MMVKHVQEVYHQTQDQETKTIDMKEDDQAMYGCVFPLVLFALACTLMIIWQLVCLVYSSI